MVETCGTINPTTLQAAQAGEEKAFVRIFTSCQQPVQAYIRRFIQDRWIAEDLTQETFFKVHRGLQSYNTERRFLSWLFTIAKRTTYDWLRHTRRTKELLIIDDPNQFFEVADGQPIAQQIETKIDMEHFLAQLDPPSRSVIRWYFWEEYTYQEIAARLHRPLNTVKTLLSRAKQKLCQRILDVWPHSQSRCGSARLKLFISQQRR